MISYNSDYQYGVSEKKMIVRKGLSGSILFFLIALMSGLSLISGVSYLPIWASILLGCNILFFITLGLLPLFERLEIWVDRENITVLQVNPRQEEVRLVFSTSEVNSVTKCFNMHQTAKGQKTDIYPIYLNLKKGDAVKIAEIISDVKTADDIRSFLITRAGLKGGRA